jgi:hypothetical protein
MRNRRSHGDEFCAVSRNDDDIARDIPGADRDQSATARVAPGARDKPAHRGLGRAKS